MLTEGMEMLPTILHLSSTDGTRILTQFSFYAFLLMPTMWNLIWWKESSLGVTVFFLIYMYTIVCSNSDINKEAIVDH